eukprot:CAMPEP_0116082186 /NCGR_PEP_ID=MMETSP0327-20121206/2597_1 /TAXON_ID=44447 /ORGANISM="Pseudo-nitzschia delicatissima, Strain B596" /LENGTH=55 /DNA_ID=CAMNT_0003572973 /DNA_START=274 /DNA_END=441 /DNA_ORIENTATION=-
MQGDGPDGGTVRRGCCHRQKDLLIFAGALKPERALTLKGFKLTSQATPFRHDSVI